MMIPLKLLLSDVPQVKSLLKIPEPLASEMQQKTLELHAQQLESTLKKMQKPLASEVHQVKAHVGALWVVDMLVRLERMQMEDLRGL